MAIQIQIRRDTAANWTSVDPILAEGEIGLETDTNQMKFGDGVLAWTALAYFGGSGNPFDQDLNTTDPVVFAGLTNNAIIYPTSDGTVGQAIVTDGAGNLSFASGANPFDQTLNTTDAVIFDKVTLTGPIIETQTAVSSSAGMVLLDCDLGNVFTLSLTENIITLNITNIPASGKAIGITLILEADGTQRTIAWPASFLWSGGTAPTITATNAKKDAIVFMTYDNGSSFLAFVAGQNL